MLDVTEDDLINRLRFDNPWWSDSDGWSAPFKETQRDFFDPMREFLGDFGKVRAAVVMGPRRVGKSVLIKQLIDSLIEEEESHRTQVLYASLDKPIYKDVWLERLVQVFQSLHDHGRHDRLYVFFDEIQYLKDWEIHLKTLVDDFPEIKFMVTG